MHGLYSQTFSPLMYSRSVRITDLTKLTSGADDITVLNLRPIISWNVRANYSFLVVHLASIASGYG